MVESKVIWLEQVPLATVVTPTVLNVKRIWVDLGDIGTFHTPNTSTEMWQDHGLGILRTILHANGLMTDVTSLRSMKDWRELGPATLHLRFRANLSRRNGSKFF